MDDEEEFWLVCISLSAIVNSSLFYESLYGYAGVAVISYSWGGGSWRRISIVRNHIKDSIAPLVRTWYKEGEKECFMTI